ncbi:hydrogenase expression/formation protein HypE [Reinekea marinisedimentorum]|uniref:Hydrogenase expression/formation protein HypE n=1 Tax=Reinekea marinisedimentorum TaxID=230495 RepID=A0A4R3HU64_9GAMM|nr:hydrogenase expression/formation protein HypE [Reinekea marinisedimentorum]TCS36757.1 hydrogenase expression/formation protein HypE [Reinekea marinisedimentorum]
MTDPVTERVTLAHGSGGQSMQKLIDELFMRHFKNDTLCQQEDQARLPLKALAEMGGELAFSTDSFVIDPIEFPGGDIGKLAVYGTANDVAMSGAKPLYLSCGFILEEGLELATLARIVVSMANAANEAGIQIVTGDTKVVPKGAADKVFINTSGIGVIPPGIQWGAKQIQPGDRIIISGTLGDHGATILNLREGLGLDGTMRSDCQHLYPLVEALRPIAGVRALRDATRGGVNAVLHEFAKSSGCGFQIDEAALPVTPEVRGICELLGLEAVNFANEGKLVAVVAEQAAEAALSALRKLPGGTSAALMGDVNSSGQVTIKNTFGGSRWLDLPTSEPMPRIC